MTAEMILRWYSNKSLLGYATAPGSYSPVFRGGESCSNPG